MALPRLPLYVQTSEGVLVEIIAHRGSWLSLEQQNTRAAFERAWAAGIGVETDLRDLDGQVVVSHDMPRSHAGLMSLGDLLQHWHDAGRRGRLALNVKADGLAAAVADALEAVDASGSAFVFDMSVPDQLSHVRETTPVFVRWSDLEAPVFAGGEVGLWLDAFSDDAWWDAAAVRQRLEDGLQVVLVSPELHRRTHLPVWERVRAEGLHTDPGFGLCTDHVDEASTFFSAAPAELVGASA